jgi:hypothetical protein
MGGRLWITNWECCGRKRSWRTSGHIPVICSRDWEKIMKLQSQQAASTPKIKPGISRIRNKSGNCSVAMYVLFSYCHVFSDCTWGWITALWRIRALYNSLQRASSLLSLLCLHWLSLVNGSQRRRFLGFPVHVLTGWRLSYSFSWPQLLAIDCLAASGPPLASTYFRLACRLAQN